MIFPTGIMRVNSVNLLYLNCKGFVVVCKYSHNRLFELQINVQRVHNSFVYSTQYMLLINRDDEWRPSWHRTKMYVHTRMTRLSACKALLVTCWFTGWEAAALIARILPIFINPVLDSIYWLSSDHHLRQIIPIVDLLLKKWSGIKQASKCTPFKMKWRNWKMKWDERWIKAWNGIDLKCLYK